MALGIQIVYDCVNPQQLSEFYAAVLGYKLQDPPEGFATWEAFLASIGVPEEEWNDGSAVVDPEGKGPRIYFQRMDTPKPAKNRLHLDFNVTGGRKTPEEERRRRIDAEVERIMAFGLGATKLSVSDDENWYFVTMLDPESNEFDVH
jgi:ATP phosphoribosyltransferase